MSDCGKQEKGIEKVKTNLVCDIESIDRLVQTNESLLSAIRSEGRRIGSKLADAFAHARQTPIKRKIETNRIRVLIFSALTSYSFLTASLI